MRGALLQFSQKPGMCIAVVAFSAPVCEDWSQTMMAWRRPVIEHRVPPDRSQELRSRRLPSLFRPPHHLGRPSIAERAPGREAGGVFRGLCLHRDIPLSLHDTCAVAEPAAARVTACPKDSCWGEEQRRAFLNLVR